MIDIKPSRSEIEDLKKIFNRDAHYPSTDIITKDNNLIIELAIPGFERDNIDIEIIGNELIISGENLEEIEDKEYHQKQINRKQFERIIVLRKEYASGDVSAKLENGILSVTIKPKEEKRKSIFID